LSAAKGGGMADNLRARRKHPRGKETFAIPLVVRRVSFFSILRGPKKFPDQIS